MCAGLVLLTAAACDSAASGAASDTLQDDDIPMGGNDEDAGADGVPANDGGALPPAAAAVGDPCDGANQCQTGICAAAFEAGDPGELVCQTACIAASDATMWCSDAASCCDPDAICSPRGLCEVAEATTDPQGEPLDGSTDSTGTGDGTLGDTSSGDITSGV